MYINCRVDSKIGRFLNIQLKNKKGKKNNLEQRWETRERKKKRNFFERFLRETTFIKDATNAAKEQVHQLFDEWQT